VDTKTILVSRWSSSFQRDTKKILVSRWTSSFKRDTKKILEQSLGRQGFKRDTRKIPLKKLPKSALKLCDTKMIPEGQSFVGNDTKMILKRYFKFYPG